MKYFIKNDTYLVMYWF